MKEKKEKMWITVCLERIEKDRMHDVSCGAVSSLMQLTQLLLSNERLKAML